jgi:hypothetical protein
MVHFYTFISRNTMVHFYTFISNIFLGSVYVEEPNYE